MAITAATLFRRDWTIIVDNLDVSNLAFEFEILSTIKKEPNKCRLVIYNLNKDHRAQLFKRNRPDSNSKKTVGIPVTIQAGYVGNKQVIFSGDLNEVSGERDGVNWKTVIIGSDGGRAYREGRINKTYGTGTSFNTILSDCAASMGVGLGNLSSIGNVEIPGIGTTTATPFTPSGNAAQELDRILRSAGFRWSIQRGNLQILQIGQPLQADAVLISPESGLIASPQATIDTTVTLGNPQLAAQLGSRAKINKPKDPGVLKLRTLLIPELYPGRKIVLKSQSLNENQGAGYELVECLYRGQSWSDTWEIESVARVY